MTLELGSLVLDEILARRADPKDDYLSFLAQAEIDGRQMDEAELGRFMVGFFTAGHETTTSALGTLLFQTLSKQGLAERLVADDNLLGAAIEEAVRLHPPFHAFHRTTTQQVEIGGMAIPADATVRLCYASANRDPEVFGQPDNFDPDRPIRPHLGFGFGRHVCVGAPLARLEMRTALNLLLKRLPDIRLAKDQIDYKFAHGLVACPRNCRTTFTPQEARKC